uniref:ATP synthase subunit I n=1 Tax=Acidobacterium capsulatum TaxID=33075 RepID=A0A7V4XU51_9BACT
MSTQPTIHLDFTDANFVSLMRRSMRNILIAGAILSLIVMSVWGWRTGLMLLVGAVISASGVREWQRLIAAINARLDQSQPPMATGRTLLIFLLRLGMVGVVLYGSLKYLQGSVYALLAGLMLAMVALTFEGLRMLRS